MVLARYALSPREILPSSSEQIDPKKRANFVFVGNGANPTNIIALHWYLKEVFPSVIQKIPHSKLVIIGKRIFIFF